jgi:hypothetical protein
MNSIETTNPFENGLFRPSLQPAIAPLVDTPLLVEPNPCSDANPDSTLPLPIGEFEQAHNHSSRLKSAKPFSRHLSVKQHEQLSSDEELLNHILQDI